MAKKALIRRHVFNVLGLIVMGLGVMLMARPAVGVSAIAAVPTVCSVAFPQLTLGTYTMLFNLLFVAGEIVLLGRRFQPIQLLQIPLSFLLGWVIDGWGIALAFLQPEGLLARYAVFLAGTVLLALSIAMVVLADVIMNASEAFVDALVKRTGWPFGRMKTALDITLVVVVCLMGLVFLGRIEAVREGTLFSALTVGTLVKGFTALITPPVMRWFHKKG